MENLQKFYINGAWVSPDSTATMPVINPANEEIIATVALGNAVDVDRAVAAASQAFATFSMTSKQERLALLERIKQVTEARFEDLAQAMREEMGAPITFAREAQADAAIGHLQGFVAALEKLEEEVDLGNGDILVREPIGVCGLITPWNWPINQIALKVLPALAAGCTCILKPSEHTPLSAIIYTEILHEAGCPPGVFNLVNGAGPEVGTAMSRHPDIQMMSFTGSTRAGTAVTQDSAEWVKRVTLELGGKSANLVFADSDLEERVQNAVAECMANTGQSCDAPTRLLVERSCYDQVVEIARQATIATRVGDPTEEGDHIGPLFDRIQFDRVQNLIGVGIDEGAQLLVGGLGKPEGFERGWYVKPTLFTDVNNQMRIAREEVFGPVLVIIPFDTEEDAIAIANDSPYGLAAYLQTGDPSRARRVARQLRAGAVHINGGAYEYGSPFGGYKQSGNGREGGSMGLEDYLETKILHGL
ncbi:aldehyde dehydrogenase family protein [Draconibacterium sp.]|nr:aldehyde dehydrogenase family protein [Luminiphilus sp.]MDB2376673.1 aldehyde dehydrogenase family protein [Luminiphilus sp.]MDB3922715.1 aldehyde dehydrogenase family protein [Luminiphilus sp.]MDB4582660.1 aldehyde dehydrogenase family protein [Draconibacterium sp.]